MYDCNDTTMINRPPMDVYGHNDVTCFRYPSKCLILRDHIGQEEASWAKEHTALAFRYLHCGQSNKGRCNF